MTNTERPSRTSLVEQIHQECSAGRIHPRIADKLVEAHHGDPGADLEELICQVISGRAPVSGHTTPSPARKEDRTHGGT
ncbi:MAG: hypothetical protein L0K12_09455 [Brevibacterium aurantiacum]|nr:hypothetical protein [Brevibacterium aurantiacum]